MLTSLGMTFIATCALTSAAAQQPGESFSDALSLGGQGPEMVVIPAGGLQMGCISGQHCFSNELPIHDVTIPRTFAVSKYEVTFDDFDRFPSPNRADDAGWGRGRRPAINVSWNDAQEYVSWLSSETGQAYRLLTEAEWEYVARARSSTAYSWGNAIGSNQANCDGCGSRWDDRQTAPVDSFQANNFGVHGMHGNVWEWVEDCWNDGYESAPSDSSPWPNGDCRSRVLRGGAWNILPEYLRSATRYHLGPQVRLNIVGFRVARTFTP